MLALTGFTATTSGTSQGAQVVLTDDGADNNHWRFL
jgi:hypothetical protein